MKHSIQAAVAAVVVAFLCRAAAAQDTGPLLRALRDAQAVQAAREAVAGCYESEQVRLTTEGGGKPSERKFVYVVARKPGFVRIAAQSDKGAITYCENPAYTFAALRKGADAFRLGHFRNSSGFGKQDGNPFNAYVTDYLSVVRPLSGVLGQILGVEVNDSSEYKIVRVGKSGPNPFIDYSARIPISTGQVLTSTGQAQFDSDLRLTSASGHGASEFELTRTYNNRHPDGGSFIDLEECTIRQGPVRIVRTFKFKMLADPVPGDHEFYMSHYGLPEPVGGVAPAGPWPFWVWLFVAAGCAAVAYLFYRLARRGPKLSVSPHA